MEEHKHLPSLDQLSILISTILLGYALTPFIKLPVQDFQIDLGIATFSFRFDYLTLVSFLVALLAGLGMDVLLRGHPHFQGKFNIQHLLLPALTAWAIGIPLNSFRAGATWWGLFALTGVLLALVFIAEYIAMDFSDLRFAISAIGLTALSYALLLILSISLRSTSLRLYLMIPSIVLPSVLVSMRTLYLRLGGRWLLIWGAAISVVLTQLAVGLQYLPVTPIGYGLIMVGSAYALTSLVGSLEEGRDFRSAWLEPAIVLIVVIGIFILTGG